MSQILLFLAVLPTIILGYFIYTNDKIEKEPTPLLVKLALGGVGSVVLTLIISFAMGVVFPFFSMSDTTTLNPISLAIYVFIGIALIEEFSKWLFIYSIAWKNKAFNHVYDAIVYSVFVSLGFATIENILYVFGNDTFFEALKVAIMRMILSVPGHAFYGVMMGYYIGLAKLTHVNNIQDKSKKYLILSILVPTTFHFLFDYLLMLNYEFSFTLFLIFVVFMFSTALSKVKRLSNVPTNIFNEPTRMDYVYNAFGNNKNMNNNIPKFCSNCGSKANGKYCSNCGQQIN